MGLYSSQIRTKSQLFREGRTPSHEYYVTTGVVKEPTVILHDTASAGAKTVNADGTVSYADIATVPAAAPAAANIIAFSGGKVEIGGAIYDLDSSAPKAEAINLDEVARFLNVYNATTLGPEFVVAAVPKYNEPVTLGQAQASGVYYTVEASPLSGELVASYHIDPLVQQDLLNYNLANPGDPVTFESLTTKRMKGVINSQESQLLRALGEAQEKLRNGRTTGIALEPVGVSFVIGRIKNFPSYPSGADSFVESDEAFQEFYGAYVGAIPSKRLRPDTPYEVGVVPGVAPAGGTPDPASDFYTNTTSFDNQMVGSSAAPGLKFERLASITLYETAADATAGVNGLNVEFNSGTKEQAFNAAVEEVTSGSAIGGLGWATVFAVVKEYYVETFNNPEFRNNSELTSYIQKENVAITYGTTLEKGFLGHLNPVYLDNSAGSNVFAAEPNPKSQLTYYADPCPLIKIRIGNCDPVAGTASIDTSDLWAQGGTANFEGVYGEFPTSNLL